MLAMDPRWLYLDLRLLSSGQRRASASAGALFVVALGMIGTSEQLRVEVLGDEIIVILSATSYGVVYYKSANSPQLLVKDYQPKNDSGARITQAEFLSRAWQAANDKARELGWIV
jgi:hypothetical protein